MRFVMTTISDSNNSALLSARINRLAAMMLALVMACLVAPGIGGMARADTFKEIRVFIDRTAGQKAGLQADGLRSLRDLFSTSYVYISAQVALDGSDPDAVTTRVEESATPEAVPCDQQNYGRLIMGADMEYLVETKVKDTNVFVSVFPGDRTEFPYNDVSCVYNGNPGQAVFQITGFYYVIANRVKGGIMVQLRPVKPTFAEARKIVARNALEQMHYRFEKLATERSQKVQQRLKKWQQKIQGLFQK